MLWPSRYLEKKAEGCLSLCFQRGDPEALGMIMLCSQPRRVILYTVFFPGTLLGCRCCRKSIPEILHYLPKSKWKTSARLNSWMEYLNDTLKLVERSSFPFGNVGSGMPTGRHRTRSVSRGTLSFLHKGILPVKRRQATTLFLRKL